METEIFQITSDNPLISTLDEEWGPIISTNFDENSAKHDNSNNSQQIWTELQKFLHIENKNNGKNENDNCK